MGGDRVPEKDQVKDAGSKLADQSPLTDRDSNAAVNAMRQNKDTAGLHEVQLADSRRDTVVTARGGEKVTETAAGKFLVAGPDGVEREYVSSDKFVQQPGPPNRWPLDGGIIDNESDKPMLVLGKGVGHPGNEHGDGYLRVLPAHTKTNGNQTDYDGVVTDRRYQPVVLPDGKILMPAKVDPDAEWTKVPDRNTGVVGKDGSVTVEKPWLPPRGEGGVYKIREYTGGAAATPETPAQRHKDEEAEAAKLKQDEENHVWWFPIGD